MCGEVRCLGSASPMTRPTNHLARDKELVRSSKADLDLLELVEVLLSIHNMFHPTRTSGMSTGFSAELSSR